MDGARPSDNNDLDGDVPCVLVLHDDIARGAISVFCIHVCFIDFPSNFEQELFTNNSGFVEKSARDHPILMCPIIYDGQSTRVSVGDCESLTPRVTE